MRVNFRQGIISHQTSGNQQTFLSFNANGNIDLLAQNRNTTLTIAHNTTDYVYIEDNDVYDAWIGPFNPSKKHWLFWDFNLLTFQRTFGVSTLEPVVQSIEPGSGDVDIINVTTGNGGIGSFTVEGHFVLPVNKPITVTNSTGNDGNYTVASTSYNGTLGETVIVVNEPIVDANADGQITLDVDSEGIPLKTDGRHWFNTTTNRHYVLNGTIWQEVLRIFAGYVVNANTFLPWTINSGSFIGTQIGNTNSVLAGRPIFDESSNPIRRDDGTFFTTEDQFFANATRVDALRLESNVARAQSNDPAIGAFQVVAWKDDGRVEVAQYDDVSSTVVGILTEELLLNQVGQVIIQGIVTNPDWNWTTGSNSIPTGSPLWVENGYLVPYDPHVQSPTTYPQGRVPVARVLDKDTVIFEQGLGGKGDQGPPGSIENLPLASETSLGGVYLTLPANDPNLPIVVGDNDPRLSDARTPLPHTHSALDVIFTPTAEVTSANVQAAIEELGDKKVNRAGDIMTGFLTLNANPTNSLHAVTKQYVDGLVNGLVWLDPICVVNMISDTETVPPTSPNLGDSYIIPAGAIGDWAGITVGHVVTWDGTNWLDRGDLLTINPNGPRFGIAMQSNTVPSGTFANHENEIAVYDNTGILTHFEIPSHNNAVYVCNNSSMFAYNQYAFSGTEWILFGGGQALNPDNTTIELNGNILSVKQFSDGGIVDSTYWQGLVPNDLNSLYAPITHTHSATLISVLPYTSGVPGLGNIASTNVQSSLEEIYDEKAALQPNYATYGDLPDPTTYEGMTAYVVGEGAYYAAMNGTWNKFVLFPFNMPYDLAFFLAGQMLFTEAVVGSHIATRTISLTAGLPNSLAIAKIAPTNNTVYTISVDNGTTVTDVGSITFTAGNRQGSFTFTNNITLNIGETLEIKTPATLDPTIQDVTITIVGCSEVIPC